MTRQKAKAFVKRSKPKNKKEEKFETPDDYQEAGVDAEERGGKWRAGDAVKSMRFFQRAIELYAEGLSRFPRDLDLAYNQARVQLEIATHPILVKQLQQPVIDALQTALASHRYALELDPDNADTLFNASQVLTSIAEEIANDEKTDDLEALKMLEEAVTLQSRCLAVQESKYEEGLEQQRLAMEQAATSSLAGSAEDTEIESKAGIAGSEDREEQWASIVEPVTKDTLIDTILAQLGTLTTFCSILSNSPDAGPPDALSWAEKHGSELAEKLPAVSQENAERLQDIALAKANFVSALLEAGFRAGKLDSATYHREHTAVFAAPDLQLSSFSDGLIANARSSLSFSLALAERGSSDPEDVSLRWSALTSGMSNLASASKLSGIGPDDLASTHRLRGDLSLALYGMSLPPTSHPPAVSQATQYLKNAEVYYRNTTKLSRDAEEQQVTTLRSAVASYLQQRAQGQADANTVLAAIPKERGENWAMGQLDEMVAEGLLPHGFTL